MHRRGAADLNVVHRFVVVVCDQPPFGGAVVGGVGAGEREVAWLPPRFQSRCFEVAVASLLLADTCV